MAEVSHADIMTRVGAVERRQERSEAQIHELRAQQRSTHELLIEHRAEFNGVAKGLKVGLGALMFVVTVGLTIIGMMVSG